MSREPHLLCSCCRLWALKLHIAHVLLLPALIIHIHHKRRVKARLAPATEQTAQQRSQPRVLLTLVNAIATTVALHAVAAQAVQHVECARWLPTMTEPTEFRLAWWLGTPGQSPSSSGISCVGVHGGEQPSDTAAYLKWVASSSPLMDASSWVTYNTVLANAVDCAEPASARQQVSYPFIPVTCETGVHTLKWPNWQVSLGQG